MPKGLAAIAVLLVAGCADEAPRRRDDRWSPSSAAQNGIASPSDAQGRSPERAQRARTEAVEQEWPEARPVVWLKGEAAPVQTKTGAAGDQSRIAQLEASARDSEGARRPAADGRPAPLKRSREREQAAREAQSAALQADADEFERRLGLRDPAVLSADKIFRSSAEGAARNWTNARMRLLADRPDEARRRGLGEPTQAEIQAEYDRSLLDNRARWMHEVLLREAVDAKMKGVK